MFFMSPDCKRRDGETTKIPYGKPYGIFLAQAGNKPNSVVGNHLSSPSIALGVMRATFNRNSMIKHSFLLCSCSRVRILPFHPSTSSGQAPNLSKTRLCSHLSARAGRELPATFLRRWGGKEFGLSSLRQAQGKPQTNRRVIASPTWALIL